MSISKGRQEMKEYSISYGGPLDLAESEWKCACGFIITPTNPPGKEIYFNVYLDRSTCHKLGLEKNLEWILLKYGFKKVERILKESEDAGREARKPIPLNQGDFKGFPEISPTDRTKLQEFIDGAPRTIKLAKREH